MKNLLTLVVVIALFVFFGVDLSACDYEADEIIEIEMVKL